MTTVPFILLALLCCVMGCTATEFSEFRCMHDEVMKNSGAMPATIVEPGPDKSGVQGAAKTASDPAWEPIRFQVFSEDLNSASQYCTAEEQMRLTFKGPSQSMKCAAIDILTEGMKTQLRTVMIPPALQLHSDRLLVQPLTGNIIVPEYTIGHCGVFTIPQSHHTTGVADADMVMYVAAGPTGGASAWAGPCSAAPNGRPVVGVMNVGPGAISNMDKNIRVVAHEVAHALGFGYDIMNSLKMVSNIADIRGETRKVVTSDVTVRKTKAHYNCDSIAGMELENEGGGGTAMSHWERRNARDELMAGILGVGYYTALTMAAFEDQKYYRANWGMEETMEWGRNAGCPFLREKCVNNGTTKYPDMFCTEVTYALVCTFGRRGVGRCSIGNYAKALPVALQYFTDPTLGGMEGLLDYCPTVRGYSNTECTDGNPDAMPGSRVGPNSVCLKGEELRVKSFPHSDNIMHDVCAEVSCEDNTVRVRYLGDEVWYPCPEGSKITPKGFFSAGKIVCPGHAEICGTNLNSGDNGINEKTDNKFDTQTTTTIPSHETPTIPSHETTTIPSHETPTIPSHETTTIPSHETTAIPSHGDDSVSKGQSSAHDGKGDVSSTDSIVDSCQDPNYWYGIFIPLCASFVYIYMWG